MDPNRSSSHGPPYVYYYTPQVDESGAQQAAPNIPPSPLQQNPPFGNPEQAWTPMQPAFPYSYYQPPSSLQDDFRPAKHRRSRQGCLTCRARRVKCDEGHPTCNRCLKGSRKCAYPSDPDDPEASTSAPTTHIKSEPSSRDPSDSPQKTILRELSREDSEGSSSKAKSKSLSPVTQHSESPIPPQPYPRLRNAPDLSHLESNHRYCLEYYLTNISHHHYGLMSDGYGILSYTLLHQALEFDPLLYAMLGFSAYMQTVANPEGELQDFLPFYSKSLSLLRQELQNKKQPTVAVLLTILQLSLLEEYLGDWVNLLGHQKAAYKILTAMYTPDSILQDKVSNVVLEWYLRFDLTAGFLAGRETTLNEPWFVSQHKATTARRDRDPDDIRAKMAERNAYTRLLAAELVTLLAKRGAGEIDQDETNTELNMIRMRFTTWYKDVDSSLFDAQKMAALPITSKRKEDAESISPFHNDIWASRFMLLKFWGTELLLNAQVAQIQGDRTASENTAHLSLRIFQMFEAIQHDDQTPGAMIGAQNAFNLACVFLGNDQARVASCRRKLARVESLGYIYPTTLRARLSEVWGIDVNHWWLENDENYRPINKRIREFVKYRTRAPTDDIGQAVRDLKGIFEGLQLGDTS